MRRNAADRFCHAQYPLRLSTTFSSGWPAVNRRDVLEKQIDGRLPVVAAERRDVRREKHVRQRQSGWSAGSGSRSKASSRRAAKPLRPSASTSARLINQPAAADVDEHRRRLHRGELFAADHGARLGRARRGQNEHVRVRQLGQEIVDADDAANAVRHRQIEPAAHAGHGEAETGRQLRHAAADFSQAHDQHAAVADRRARHRLQLFLRPDAIDLPAHGRVQAAPHRQHQRDGVFRDRLAWQPRALVTTMSLLDDLGRRAGCRRRPPCCESTSRARTAARPRVVMRRDRITSASGNSRRRSSAVRASTTSCVRQRGRDAARPRRRAASRPADRERR